MRQKKLISTNNPLKYKIGRSAKAQMNFSKLGDVVLMKIKITARNKWARTAKRLGSSEKNRVSRVSGKEVIKLEIRLRTQISIVCFNIRKLILIWLLHWKQHILSTNQLIKYLHTLITNKLIGLLDLSFATDLKFCNLEPGNFLFYV